MLGWMDDEALARTLTTGRATYWSRVAAGVLGQGRDLRPPAVGQGGPARLRRRHPAGQGRPGGPACHTGDRTCFDADLVPGRRCAEPPPYVRPGRAARAGRRRPDGASPASRTWVEADVRRRRRRRRGVRPTTRPGSARCRSPARSAWSCWPRWGVVLVTRGRVRRVVAVLGLLGRPRRAGRPRVVGWSPVPDAVRDEYAPLGVDGRRPSSPRWYAVALVAAAACCVVATALAVRWCPAWPEMGSRYDAPGAERPSPPPSREDRRASICGRRSTRGATPPS